MAGRGRERGKVKIQWIIDSKKRKTALKRRLRSLVKKARELAVLCDVPVCLVAYRPGEAEPVVWPPSPEDAREVLRQYRSLPAFDRSKNKLDNTGFVKQMNDKLSAKLSKIQLQVRELEINNVIVDYLAGRRGSFDDLPTDFFISLGMKVEDKLQAIHARLQEIRSAPALLPPPPHAREDVQMVEPLAVMQPPLTSPLPQHNVAMTPLMRQPPPPQHNCRSPMTLDGEPRHGSYLFEVLDAFNDPSDGSALPSAEEFHAVFVQAGIFSPPLPNPSFHP